MTEPEKSLGDKLNENIEKLAVHLQKANITEYLQIMERPWRFFWFNFFAGVARGLGTAVGVTVVFGLVIYFLGKILAGFVSLPLIGYYVAEIVRITNQSLQVMPK